MHPTKSPNKSKLIGVNVRVSKEGIGVHMTGHTAMEFLTVSGAAGYIHDKFLILIEELRTELNAGEGA